MLTAAWSEGNDAVGNSLRIVFKCSQAEKIGLCLKKKNWIIILTIAIIAVDNEILIELIWFLLFFNRHSTNRYTSTMGYVKTKISARIQTECNNILFDNTTLFKKCKTWIHQIGSYKVCRISTKKINYLKNDINVIDDNN